MPKPIKNKSIDRAYFDKKFGTIDKEFGAVEKKLGAHTKRFDVLEQRIATVDKKQDESLDAVIHNFEKVYGRLDKHTTQSNILEQKMDETQTHLANYHNRLDQEFEVLRSRVGKIEEILKQKLGVKLD